MGVKDLLTRGKAKTSAAKYEGVKADEAGASSAAEASFTEDDVKAAAAHVKTVQKTAYAAAAKLGFDSNFADALAEIDDPEKMAAIADAIDANLTAQAAESANEDLDDEDEEEREGEVATAKAGATDFLKKDQKASLNLPDSPAPDGQDAESSDWDRAADAILADKSANKEG